MSRPARFSLTCVLALSALLASACSTPEPEETPPPRPDASQLRVDTAHVVESDPALRYEADLAYPQLAPAERPAIERVNRALREAALALAHSARPDPNDLTGDPAVDRWVLGEIQGSFRPTLLQEDLFSTLLQGSVYTGGAHGNLVAVPLTFDLRTGEPIELRDLFRRNVAYLDTLAALATERLADERDGADWLFDGAVPPVPEAFPAFALRPDSLLLFFPPYSIAPYAFGPSEVRLAYTRLEEVLDPNGPVARLYPDLP